MLASIPCFITDFFCKGNDCISSIYCCLPEFFHDRHFFDAHLFQKDFLFKASEMGSIVHLWIEAG